jgi:hypothetical protein
MRKKLYNTLQKVGLEDPSNCQERADKLLPQLEFLDTLRRYKGLLKSILSSGEINEFNSYAFEVAFAYDFESKDQPLLYEVITLPESQTSIDYCYKTERNKIYFELRVINQMDALTKSQEAQLKRYGNYKTMYGGNEQRQEIIRLQNLILSKCQDPEGNPIKFRLEEGSYNFIVVFVSGLQLGMIDKDDCKLSMFGDASVDPFCRRSVFGLCQQLPDHAPEERKELYKKFNHFQKTIHGVLFVRNFPPLSDPSGRNPHYFIDLKLQYFLLRNENILDEKDYTTILNKLSFLQPWKAHKRS